MNEAESCLEGARRLRFRRGVIFSLQTLSAFSNPLDLFDKSLLLDMLFLGAPQLRTGLGFLFFFKVSFMKHPTVL